MPRLRGVGCRGHLAPLGVECLRGGKAIAMLFAGVRLPYIVRLAVAGQRTLQGWLHGALPTGTVG